MLRVTTSEKDRAQWSREEMARLVAEDIADGSYVNLGIGIPELVAQFVPRRARGDFSNGKRAARHGPGPGSRTGRSRN